MKYLVLLVGYGEMTPWEEESPEEQQAVMEQHYAFDQACGDREGVAILSGEALVEASLATTVRTRGGERTVTDGPFAEAVEHLGGFYLIKSPDLDTLLDLLTVLPPYDIEIRPAFEVD